MADVINRAAGWETVSVEEPPEQDVISSAQDEQEPPLPPRAQGAIKLSFRVHLRKNWRCVVAVVALVSVFGTMAIRMVAPRLPISQALFVLLCVILGAIEGTYCCQLQWLRRRKRLLTDGLATKAVIDYVGMRQRGGKYAWVAEWKYNVDGHMWRGVCPLRNVPQYKEGDELWIVYDSEYPRDSLRWRWDDKIDCEGDDEVEYYDKPGDDPRDIVRDSNTP